MKYFKLIVILITISTFLFNDDLFATKGKNKRKAKSSREKVTKVEVEDNQEQDKKASGEPKFIKRNTTKLGESKHMEERKTQKEIKKGKMSYYWMTPKAGVNTDGYPRFAYDIGLSFSTLMNLNNKNMDIKLGLFFEREKFLEKLTEKEYSEDNLVTKTDIIVGQLFELYGFRLNIYEDIILWNYEKTGSTTLFDYRMQHNVDEYSLIVNPGYYHKLWVFGVLVFGGYKIGLSSDTGNIDVKQISKFSYQKRTYDIKGYNAGISINVDNVIEVLFAYQVYDNKIRKNSYVVQRAEQVFPFVAQSTNYKTTSYGLTLFLFLKNMELDFIGNTKKLPAIVASLKRNLTDYDERPGTVNTRFEFGLEFR